MCWNAASLRGTKELSLAHLLEAHNLDVAIITETELSEEVAPTFTLPGYIVFLPLTKMARVIALIKSELATRADASLAPALMSPEV